MVFFAQKKVWGKELEITLDFKRGFTLVAAALLLHHPRHRPGTTGPI